MRVRYAGAVLLVLACGSGSADTGPESYIDPDGGQAIATAGQPASSPPGAAGKPSAATSSAPQGEWEPGEMLSRDLIEKWRHATEIAWEKAGGDPKRVFTADGGMNSTPRPLDVLQVGRESGIDLTIFSNVNRMIYSFVIAPRYVGDAATEDLSEEVRQHNDRFVAENREWILEQLGKLGYTGDVRS